MHLAQIQVIIYMQVYTQMCVNLRSTVIFQLKTMKNVHGKFELNT